MTVCKPILTVGLLLCLGGCGLFAAPCRIASAGLDIIPVAGHVLATPTNGCAAAIDP
jgi:hypothetical protein